MQLLGYLILGALLCAVTIAAGCSARRARLRAGAEFLLGVQVAGAVLILLPIHVLGLAGHLNRALLALSVLAASLTTVLFTRGRTPVTEWVREVTGELVDSAAGLGRLLREAWSAGVLPLVALCALLAAILWCTLLVYLCPSNSWDGIWYHELMTGYAIQQHGYAAIDMPRVSMMQQANGYPRNGEMLGLLFAIFTGRTFIEMPSVIAAVTIALATYLLCIRFGGNRLAAALWASALVLVPGARLEMRTTYIDGIFAAFLLAGTYFVADADLDGPRSLFAAAGLALALGSKGLGLLSVPWLAALGVAILVVRYRKRPGVLLANLAAGAAIFAAVGCVQYVLNWHRWGDPFWPLSVSVGPFHFEGLPNAANILDVNGTENVLTNLFSVPVPGHDYTDTRVTGYGLFVGFLLLPICAIGAVRVLIRAATGCSRAIREVHPPDGATRQALVLLALTGIAAFGLYKSPALWGARYNLHGVGVAIVLGHVGSSFFGAGRAGSLTAASAAVLTNIIMWCWSDPGWGVSFDQAIDRLGESIAKRESYDPLRSFLVPDTILARDRELGGGDEVVWTDGVDFAALLWNSSYSNRLVYLEADPNLGDEAYARGAKWLAVPKAGKAAERVRSDGHWQEVGLLHSHPENQTVILRRVGGR